MANSLISPTIIAKEALMQLENNCLLGNLVHREYKEEFDHKNGESIQIRRPVKFSVTNGATRSGQDVEEASFAFGVATQKHVSWDFTSLQKTMTVEDYSERYIKPAMIALANDVDMTVAALYKDVWNFAGTPGTTPATFLNVADVSQRLDDTAVPKGMRRYVTNPAAGYKIADAIKSTFIQGNNKSALEMAKVGMIAGFDHYMDQNIQTHTVGVATGTPVVNGANQNVTYANSKSTYSQTLNTDGWTNSTTGILKQGDVITIAGVFAVNPVSKATLPFLQQFVVKADADSGASTGPAALTISPPIITSGPYKTVSAAPADNAAITVVTGTGGTGYPQNLGFHRNAFGLVVYPLEIPDGVSWSARETKNNYSVRVIKDYDIENDKEIIRLDILLGAATLYADLACRHTG